MKQQTIVVLELDFNIKEKYFTDTNDIWMVLRLLL